MSYYDSGYGYEAMTTYDRALLEDHEKLNQGIEPQNYDDYFEREREKERQPEDRRQIEEKPQRASRDDDPYQREKESTNDGGQDDEPERAAEPSPGRNEPEAQDIGLYQPQAVDQYGRPRISQRQSVSVQTYTMRGMVVTATRIRTTRTRIFSKSVELQPVNIVVLW